MLRSSRFSCPFTLGALPPVLLGGLLCLWSLIDNGTTLCVTTGCTLFQDFSVAGISLWWFGLAAFLLLFVLLLLGKQQWGMRMAGLCLLLDTLLLTLMLLTAPCMACLGVALFFALSYCGFRNTVSKAPYRSRSWLLWVWTLLFIVNIGAVVRIESGSWPIQGDNDARLTLYFSPSCPVCREGVFALSGRVDVAFYPVAEDLDDVWVISLMQERLKAGDNIADALRAGRRAALPDQILERWRPDMALLGFRLLRNRAHVLTAGSNVLPFLEYRGLPSSLKVSQKQSHTETPLPEKTTTVTPSSPVPATPMSQRHDYALPFDTDIADGCPDGGADKLCR